MFSIANKIYFRPLEHCDCCLSRVIHRTMYSYVCIHMYTVSLLMFQACYDRQTDRTTPAVSHNKKSLCGEILGVFWRWSLLARSREFAHCHYCTHLPGLYGTCSEACRCASEIENTLSSFLTSNLPTKIRGILASGNLGPILSRFTDIRLVVSCPRYCKSSAQKLTHTFAPLFHRNFGMFP